MSGCCCNVAGVISAGVSVPVQIPSQTPDLTSNYWPRIQWSQLFGFPPPRLLVHPENPVAAPSSCSSGSSSSSISVTTSAAATTTDSIVASSLLLQQQHHASCSSQQVPRDEHPTTVLNDATQTPHALNITHWIYHSCHQR